MGNGNVNRGNVIGNVGGSGSGSGGAGVDRRVDEIINGTLPVGLAKNLVTAVDVAQNGQSFIRRTSGGAATIRNGSAYLNKVYGNMVKENDTVEDFSSANDKINSIQVNQTKFKTQISTVGSYEFSYDGTEWSYGGNPVTLEDYGIDPGTECHNGDIIVATVAAIPLTQETGVTCKFKTPTRYTATFDMATFRSAVSGMVRPGEDATITFTYYDGQWYINSEQTPVSIASYGMTVTGNYYSRDRVIVKYTRSEYGAIIQATPSKFTAYGLNLFDNRIMYIEGYGINANGNVVAEAGKTLCYARAVYNSGNTAGYTVYDSNKTVTKVGWVATLPTTSTTGITLGTANSELSHVTFAADGYVVCVCTKKTGICIHPTWDGEFDRAYAEYSESVITFHQSMALYAVSSALRDELNLTTGVLTHNVTRIAYTASALAALLAAHTTWVSGTDYIHDNEYIYHRATTATTESVTVSGKEFNVNVYSLEEFSGTSVAVGCDFTYGNGSVGGGSLPTEESVTIQLAVNTGSGSVSGKTMTVRYTSGSQEYTQSLTADASGKATINIPYGAMYRVEPSSMSGYMALNTPYNPAVLSARTINITYTLMDTGFFVITTDKQIIPRLGWNTDWNDRAEFVMYYDSQLAGNPIIYPKILNVSSHIFQPENIDCPLITNRSNADAANADYAGKSQCALWLQWARTPDATTGKSPVQTWNEGHSASLTEYTYLAAIGAAYNKTKTWSGETVHGYLPAMGQLRKLCDNRTDAAALHTLIGGSTFPNLASGYWWSCSEYDSSYCWFLGNGSTRSYGKDYSSQVFALYDLSDVNL